MKRIIAYAVYAVSILLFLNYVTETLSLGYYVLSEKKEVDLTVLCYNVKCTGEVYVNNQRAIAKQILRKSPDVVFLCEFNRSVSKQLDSIMLTVGGYQQYYRSGMNGIFYSRCEIDSIAAIDTRTSKGKRAKNNSIHLYLNGDTIAIFGCHLSSSRKDFVGGIKERKQEADSLYKAISEESYPVIVMGDLNDISSSYTISKMKKAGLKDAWWEGGCGYGATYHDGWLRLRVDYILYDDKGLELVDVKVIDNNLSDHNVLMAGFKMKN